MRRALIGAVVIGVAALGVGASSAEAAQTHARRGRVFQMQEFGTVHGNPSGRRHDRLDMVMNIGNGSPIELKSAADRCLNYGGEPIVSTHARTLKSGWVVMTGGHKTIMLCEGIDY
jgi:hypothetical protein